MSYAVCADDLHRRLPSHLLPARSDNAAPARLLAPPRPEPASLWDAVQHGGGLAAYILSEPR